MRREAPPPAGKIKSPPQGPQFTRSIWTFSATGKWLATSSAHARIIAGVAIAGMGFWALISRIAASCCFDILVLLGTIPNRDLSAGLGKDRKGAGSAELGSPWHRPTCADDGRSSRLCAA